MLVLIPYPLPLVLYPSMLHAAEEAGPQLARFDSPKVRSIPQGLRQIVPTFSWLSIASDVSETFFETQPNVADWLVTSFLANVTVTFDLRRSLVQTLKKGGPIREPY